MRVFGLTTGADTAGINYAIAGAFARHAPDWSVRAMVATVNYIEYPVDMHNDGSRSAQRKLREHYDMADVIHLHNTLHGHDWYDKGQGKPTVLHHHGMKNGSERPFDVMVRDAREVGAVQVASTLDLAIRQPDLTWVGAPVNLRDMRMHRARNWQPSKVIRIGHAPTERNIKGTAAFEAAMARLAEKYPVEPVLIERAKWLNCLRRKAGCDLFFDQPVLGYGSNAIEAWAMGMPVVAGIADPAIREGMLDRWGVLPFYEASADTLYDALRALVEDNDLRTAYAKRGKAHVQKWHDEKVTVATLKGLYEKAPQTKPGGVAKRAAA